MTVNNSVDTNLLFPQAGAAINTILWCSAANTVAGLATANNGVLITSAGGVPSISSTLPSAVQGNITTVGTVTSGTWNGSVIGGTYGGTGVNNGASTITLGGSLTTSGAFATTFTMTAGTSVTFPTSGTLATTSQIPAFPLSLANGGTNANLTASNGGIFYSTGTAGAILSGTATANQVLLSGSNTTPAWSTATYPATTSINQILYSSSANTVAGLTATANGTLITGAAGIPSIAALANGTILIGTAGAPAASTATYPATTTINQLLYSSSANVIGGLATANNGVLTTGTSGIPVITALGTDGQVIIGSSAGAPAAATLTAGTGITITNGHNTITIASTGAGTWNTSTSTPITLAVNQNYVANSGSAITFNVPATAAVGDQFRIEGLGAGLSVIQMNTGQTCHFGSNATTSGGTLTATNQYDAITIVCTVANTTFNARGQGNWTIA